MKTPTHILVGSGELLIDVDGPAIPLRRCGSHDDSPVSDVAAAADAALARPIGYPPLDEAVMPGDRIVIAIDWGVPHLPEVIAGITKTLDRIGVEPCQVTFLLADADDGGPSLLGLARRDWQAATVVAHDPHDRGGLGYLAANRKAEPIYLHRALLDADFLLPIAVRRFDDHGIHGGLFPSFSDAATAGRFSSIAALTPEGRERCRRAADEVGWLLGSRLTVQIVPGTGGGVARVVAGDVDQVSTLAQQQLDARWQVTLDEESSLTVACVGGPPNQWRNVARALEAAMQVTEEEGSILICCQLSGRLGPALQQLAGEDSADGWADAADDPPAWTGQREDRQHVAGQPSTDDGPSQCSPDRLLASVLSAALPRFRIYLYSQLDEEDVGRLGLIHVGSREEIANLCRRHPSLAVLPDAENLHVQVRRAVDQSGSPIP